METLMVGPCVDGTQTCKADGTGFGPCEGQVIPVEEDCATPEDESCDGFFDDGPPMCTGSVVWAKQMMGMGDQMPLASAVDSQGNVIVAGLFEGTADIAGKELPNAGNTDAFVAKFGPKGDSVFSVSFSGPGEEEASAVAVDGDGNTIVVGSFTGSIYFGGQKMPVISAGMSDIFVAKLNPSGSVLWSYGFGDAKAQHATGVAVDSMGNILVAGRFEGTLDWGGGATLTNDGAMNAFLVKLDPNGGYTWSKQFGEALAQGAEAVAVNDADEVLLAGWFEGSINLGDGAKSGSGEDAFVAKFSEAGSLIWSGSIGGLGNARATAITADKGGNVIMAGYFSDLIEFGTGTEPGIGEDDIFLVKYTAGGSHIWHHKLGSNLNDRFMSVATDSLSNILVSGFISGSPDFGDFTAPYAGGTDAFLGKLDPGGIPMWLKTIGDGDDQRGTGVAIAPGDDVIWTGDFAGKIRLGNHAFTSGDVSDGFVAQILD
jgi:hypothetical protein